MSIKNKLRAQESYYDTQKISDKLYADSKIGKKFDKLYELIIDEKNIILAYRNIKKNKGSQTAGIDENTVENYKNTPVEELVRIVQDRLKNYIPQAVRRVYYLLAIFWSSCALRVYRKGKWEITPAGHTNI